MGEGKGVHRGHSRAADGRQAVREFHAQVGQAGLGLVVFFCSSSYDLDAVADEMNRAFGDLPVVGCTSSGEIGPAGYQERSLSGFALSARDYPSVAAMLDRLQAFEIGRGRDFAGALKRQLAERDAGARAEECFALLLIDGLSRREEVVAHAFQSALGDIVVVGGSASDDLQFTRSWVFHGGAFHADAAVLVLVHSTRPFRSFKTQHFVSQDERLVVTDADAPRRIVREINGLPAAEEYARIVGAELDELTPQRFAAAPVVVLIDGTDYVRSIQKVNADGSLTFYSAIEAGLVLRVASATDIVDDLERTLAGLREELGPLDAVLAFDCVLRNLELAQGGLKDAVGEILCRNRAVGFSTYGEQFRGVHVNQTLTGVALGS